MSGDRALRRWWRARLGRPQAATGDIVRVTGDGKVQPHDWRECRPVIAVTEDYPGLVHGSLDPLREARFQAALHSVWLSMPDTDRQAFHRVSCLNSRAPTDVAAMKRISTTLRTEIATLERRDHAR